MLSSLPLRRGGVSQCLGRKIGLCRAQRLESPKAARQIQPLQSVMPRFASRRSSHFKLHSLSPTSQLWTDGFLCLPHGVSSVETLLLFFFISLGFICFVYRSPLLFSVSFTLLLFVSGDVCNTSLAVYCTDWFSHDVQSGTAKLKPRHFFFLFKKLC